MQPLRPMYSLSSANAASTSFKKSASISAFSISNLSQVHNTNGACSCPFCLWTTGTRWSSRAPKNSNAESQTERYSNQPAFFEDDPKKMTAAMLHNTRRRMRPCFFEWMKVVEINLKVKRKQQATLNKWKKQSAYSCLKDWIQVIFEKKEFKRKCAKVIQMMLNSGLVSSMEKWKSVAKNSKGAKNILEKFLLTMQTLNLRKAFRGWAIKVDVALTRKETLRKVAEIWWGNISKKYFELWFEISATEAELRNLAAVEGIPPAWKPPRHMFILNITATIKNLVSDGIGKVGLTFCGLNTTSEIGCLDFEGTQTAQCTLSSYTHLGKITSAILEKTNHSLRFSRIDVHDETLGAQYLFLDPEQPKESAESQGVLKAVSIFRRKPASGADSVGRNDRVSDAVEQTRKLLPVGEPSIVAEPRPPPVVKKLCFTFESPNKMRSKIQAIEKWLRSSVINIKLLHTASSTNFKAAHLYLEYSQPDASSITPAMNTIHAFCKSLSSRTLFVQSWKSGRFLAFLSLVASQRLRFQGYCLQLNFLWSRISSHHIRAQYLQSWTAAFSLMNYLRVRSTPIVIERNRRAANVLLRGLKRFRNIMYYRKWLKWKSRLQSWIVALLPRRRLNCVLHLKRICLAEFGAHRKRFHAIRNAAVYVTRLIKADAVSRRLQRMYLYGLSCVRLIQSQLRVQFQKKTRAKVLRLLNEREQHALAELQKVTELKTLLEQCHSPESSAAYWRKYGKPENPEDVKQVKLSWASMQSIVRKTVTPVATSVQERLHLGPEQSYETTEGNSGSQNIASSDHNVDCDTSTVNLDPEQFSATQEHSDRCSGHRIGMSPFLKRIEEANRRATELRKNGYEEVLKMQRLARGTQSTHLVHEMKLGQASSTSPDRSGSASQVLSLPEIRATFRKLRTEESLEIIDWAPPIKAVFVPNLSRNTSDCNHVPNPPSALVRNAQALMSLRSKRLALKKSDSS